MVVKRLAQHRPSAGLLEQLRSELAATPEKDVALAVFARLISDPRMKRVWAELYKKKRTANYKGSGEFVHPARVSNATWAAVHRRQAADLRQKGGKRNEEQARLLEAEAAFEERQRDPPGDPRWSEQDRGVQLFVYDAVRSAIDIEPIFFSDLQARANDLRETAERLRREASALRSSKQKVLARKLDERAADHDDEARNLLPQPTESEFAPQADDPWVIRRDRGDAEIRTYVADLSIKTCLIFKENLFGVLAIVANVVHERSDITRANVREWLRDPRERKDLASAKGSS